MKMRERIDELGIQMSKLTDVLRLTQTEQHGFALDYRLRLELYNVATSLKDFGYEYQAPEQLPLESLIKRECKEAAKAGSVDAGDIVNRVHTCLVNHPHAHRTVKNESGASDILESVAWDYLHAEIESYLFGPPLEESRNI